MIIYVLTFAISLFFVYRAQLSNSIVGVVIFCFLGALIPSFVAGVRDLSIGVDVSVYAEPCYNLAETTDFDVYTIQSARWGVLFPLLIYGGYLMGSLSWGLGFVEFFVCMNVLIALFLQRRKMSVVIGYFLFLFLFYNMSFNLMRQSMALACCSLAFSLMLKSKWKIAVIPLILGFLSHSSVLIFSLLLLEFYLLVVKRNKKGLYEKVIYLGIPLVTIMYQKILDTTIVLGIVSNHYEAYGEGNVTSFSYTNTLSQLCFFVFMQQFAKKNALFRPYKKFSLIAVYTAFFLTILSIINVWAFRAAFYIEIIYIVLFPLVLQTTTNKQLVKLFCFFVIVLWFYDAIINGVNGTYPYTSDVLPLLF